MRKLNLALILIFLLAVLLRFYRLGDIPVGLHKDEAFLGYNAYAILNTGKDISGNFLPLHLASFLYSPAGYSYFSIPFIKFFDLSVFSVRFASALFGSLTLLTTYFLTKELFGSKNHSLKIGNWKLEIPEIACLFLAVSPWHINLSRTATENTIVVFFISLGVLLYLHWLKRNSSWLLFLSFISFGITILVYQAPRSFLPIFIPVMMLFFLRKQEDKKNMVMPIMLYIAMIVIPLFFVLSSPVLSLRIRTVSIFATEQTQLVLDEQIREDGVSQVPRFITRVFHNKVVGYSQQFLQNYFKHFTYDFLFTDQGFPARYHIPLVGLIYIVELPLLLAGIIFLLTNKNRAGLFLLSWVALAPIGSSLAFDDVPNLQRTLLIFPSLSILSAFGLLYILSLCKQRPKVAKGITIFIAMAFTCNVLFYLHQYYTHAPLYRPWYRNDGYKELVKKVNTLMPNYKKVVVTDRESSPTIFFLFYGKYSPVLFQQETKKTTMHDFVRIGFGKYECSREDCPVREIMKDGATIITGKRGILYVNSGLCKTPKNVRVLHIIKRMDNSIAFRIVDLQ